jgi:hypothetical protein
MPARRASCRVRSWVLSTTTASKNEEETKQVGGHYAKPADLKLRNRQLITVGFVPSGDGCPSRPPRPILALLQAIAGVRHR